MPATSSSNAPADRPIDKAFVLGAGLGTRLRPLTDTVPKPLATIAGRTLLDRALDGLAQAGVTQAVINTHHLAPVMKSHLERRTGLPQILISHEPDLLDTGGGIKNALGYFDDTPFYVLSGDGLWTDGPHRPALARMAKAWNPAIMDILILLQPLASFTLTQGSGDYDCDAQGRAQRSRSKTGAYMFTSMRVNHPRIFVGTQAGAFSYLECLDTAERHGRLFGLVHDAEWHHISTKQDLENADRDFTARGL